MTRFYFHLGIHKTGTSALQARLGELRGPLSAAGCLFPRTGIDIPATPSKLDAHHGHGRFAAAVRQASPRGAQFLFETLRREIEASRASRVVLSSEMFGAPHFEDRLAQLKTIVAGDAPCEAVVYLRRQDVWLDSFYREVLCWAKSRQTASIETFFHERAEAWFDFERRLSVWARIFGEDALKVRFYDDLLAEGRDITADFLSLIGARVPAASASTATLNPSLPRHLVELMRAVNALEPEALAKASLARALISQSAPDEAGSSLITPELYSLLADRFARPNAAIASRFGAREDSRFLFTPAPPGSRAVRPSISACQAPAILARYRSAAPAPAARSGAKSNTFAMVTTLRQGREQTEAYINYHLNLGVAHMIVYFDDPCDASARLFESEPRVTVVRCDAAHWQRRLGRPPARMYEKQMTNFAEGYARLGEMGIDWIVSVDCDELLHADRPIGEILAAASPSIEGVKAPPYEAILHRDMAGMFGSRYFKSLEPAGAFSNEELARAYRRDIQGLTRQGFFGHVNGKTFIRPGLDIAHFGVHDPRPADRGLRVLVSPDIRLLHFDCLSVPLWREKWHRRIFGDTRAVNITAMRARQQALIRQVLSCEGDTVLEALAKRWFWFNSAEIRDLELAGLVRRFEIDEALFTRGEAPELAWAAQ